MSSAEVVSLERQSYDDPFLDIASTKLPKTFKKILEMCQIFALGHPQVSPIIWRLAEYPITGLVYKADAKVIEAYKTLFEKKLKIHEKIVEWGIDYYGYGNAFITISFPFMRFYRCKVCNESVISKDLDYVFRDGLFSGRCKKCKTDRDFTPEDEYTKSPDKINVFRLEPLQMDVKYNRVTGQYFYHYEIPDDLVAMVKRGDRDIIDTTPVEYLKCIQQKRKMRIKRVFHFKRPTISGRDMAWGFPLVMPALKDIFLNQVYKKADEQIALEHSVPLRFLFPEPTSQDPLRSISMGTFKKFMERNLRVWRKDKNAIITSPVPVGARVLGGEANSYSTINSRVKVVDEIMGAMMVTRGFVMGGEQWSSASISQRILENTFLSYLRRLDACLQWVTDEVSSFLEMPHCDVTLRPFKKVDDIQQLTQLIGLAQERRVSWGEVLSRMDIEYAKELEQITRESVKYTNIMIQEMMSQAEATAKATSVQAAGQQEAQGLSEMMQQIKTRAAGVVGEIQGKGTVEEVEQQGQQAQEQGQQQEAQQQQVAVDGQAALNEDRRARAARNTAEAQAKAQPPQEEMKIHMGEQIERWAQELAELGPDKARLAIESLIKDAPETAEEVVQRAEQIKAEQKQSGTPEVMEAMQQLMSESKKPADMAESIGMLQPRLRLGVLEALRRQNPQLFARVVSIMSTGREQDKSNQPKTDMRPLPEQAPPRREQSPV